MTSVLRKNPSMALLAWRWLVVQTLYLLSCAHILQCDRIRLQYPQMLIVNCSDPLFRLFPDLFVGSREDLENFQTELGLRIILLQSLCFTSGPRPSYSWVFLVHLESKKTWSKWWCYQNFFWWTNTPRCKLLTNDETPVLLTASSCHALRTYHQGLAVVIQAVVACKSVIFVSGLDSQILATGMLVMRVYALYGGRRVVLVFYLLILAVTFIIGSVSAFAPPSDLIGYWNFSRFSGHWLLAGGGNQEEMSTYLLGVAQTWPISCELLQQITRYSTSSLMHVLF